MRSTPALGGVQLTTEQSAGHNIFVLGNIVAGGYYERAQRPFGLSLAQWTVLRTVLISPESSQADVAASCGLNVMNVSRAVAGLRDKGLLETTTDPRNNRRNILLATELGESISTDLAERERLLYDHVFDGLSAEDLDRLDSAVHSVITRLAEHPPPEPPPPSRDWRAVFADARNTRAGRKSNHRTKEART